MLLKLMRKIITVSLDLRRLVRLLSMRVRLPRTSIRILTTLEAVEIIPFYSLRYQTIRSPIRRDILLHKHIIIHSSSRNRTLRMEIGIR